MRRASRIPIQNQTAFYEVMGGERPDQMNAVRRSLLGNIGKHEGAEADFGQLSLILRSAIRAEKVELAPKRTVVHPVLCYELIENKIAFALVKSLVNQH